MIYEIVQPYKLDPQHIYIKCLGSCVSDPSCDAWDMQILLENTFPNYDPHVVHFGGFENCLCLATTSRLQ